MKLVVLDAYTANPGDLSWAPLQALCDCTLHDRTAAADRVARAAAAELVLTNKVVLDAAVIAQLPRLRYIGVTATGTNVVDLAAARARGIVVTNVPAYSTPSVAQLVLALLLELTHHTGQHDASVHAGDWVRCPDFAYWQTPLVELSGRTLGVIGYGQIGRQVCAIAQALGMTTLAHTRSPLPADATGVTRVDLETLLRRSDVVSLHCPLTPETAGLINAARLALMPRHALLINTARGGLIVEVDLAAALHAGTLAGAGLDVLSREPPPADNPLLTAPRCIITPHLGWATLTARQRLLTVTTANVAAFLAGTPQNVVT